jgi:alkylation response protein AidB-like acyl-CoA dehydrogenase
LDSGQANNLTHGEWSTAMNFRDNPEEAVFRSEVKDFIAREYTGSGDEGEARTVSQAAAQGGPEAMARYQAWMKKLAKKGWIASAWPVEYGGAGMTIMQQFIFNEELALARAPRPGGIGIAMAGPTIIVYGTDEQKKEHLSGMLSGDIVWCQGFSESESGSDLASLRTTAVKDGDDYIVNGQKIWTTGAQFSQRMILLARTDTQAPKHKGISYFLLEMKSPGVSFRPIVNMVAYQRVFFDNVRIPKRPPRRENR